MRPRAARDHAWRAGMNYKFCLSTVPRLLN
jgi:hypothetical protein